jgi:zinc transport system substrate-binding protein
VGDLLAADLFFRAGMPFETALLSKLEETKGALSVVDTRAGIALRVVEGFGHEHEHAPAPPSRPAPRPQLNPDLVPVKPDDDRSVGEPDPHIWMNPLLAIKQAEAMRDALARIDPDRAEVYRANLESLKEDLSALDRRIEGILSPFKGRRILVFHPSYGYFTDRYGLKQTPIETGGKSPGAQRLAELIARAKQEKAGAVFVQPQFDQKSARAVADAIGASVVVFDPLAEDYIENLEQAARKIGSALKPEKQEQAPQ